MSNPNLELILFKVGEKFLQYVLNYNEPIVRLKKDHEYRFNKQQIEVIKRIESLIHKCEITSTQNLHSTIKQHLFNFGKDFNNMRIHCGGILIHESDDNKILNYILEKATEYYPCLLLIEEKKSIFFNNNHLTHYFLFNKEEGKYVYNLIADDKDFHNISLDNEDAFFSFINYKLESNISVICHKYSFLSNFIIRSFHNCCYRTKYDMQSFLEEIKYQFSCLKKIAKGELVEISNFCGIYGLKLDGIDEYELSENIIIRNINETNNPGIKNTTSIGSSGSRPKQIIGCTLEFKTKLNPTNEKAKIHSLDSTIVLGNNDEHSKNENSDIFEKLIFKFISATVISMKSIYAPFNVSFIDKDAPLSSLPSTINEKTYSSLSFFKNQELDEIKEWFELLDDIDLNYISLTLRRITIAIYGREQPLDSILDTFIAWETMFSSKISTTNSVITSIKSILDRSDYRISKTRLSKLYGLRSNIVHGSHKKHELLNVENSRKQIEIIKMEVIEISIIILKELIKDKSLLLKTPKERVEILLKTKTITCKKCGSHKYEFT